MQRKLPSIQGTKTAQRKQVWFRPEEMSNLFHIPKMERVVLPVLWAQIKSQAQKQALESKDVKREKKILE